MHPKGAAYDLVHLVDQRLLMFPWHFAPDRSRPIEQARFEMSKLLEDLLTGPTAPDPQLSMDDIALTEDELNARYAEEAETAEQLRAWGGFVIVGFASSPHQLHRVGWGVGHISDPSTGEVYWEEPWAEIDVEKVLRRHPLPDVASVNGVPRSAPQPAAFAEGMPEPLGLTAKKAVPTQADSQ